MPFFEVIVIYLKVLMPKIFFSVQGQSLQEL